MDKNEFNNWFTEQVAERWPKWETNSCILGDWFAAFGKYDRQLLTSAIQKHKIYDDLPAPSTKRILAIVKSLQPRTPAVDSESNRPVDVSAFRPLRERLRTTFTRQQRIDLMRSLIKFYPKAKELDSETYELVRAESQCIETQHDTQKAEHRIKDCI